MRRGGWPILGKASLAAALLAALSAVAAGPDEGPLEVAVKSSTALLERAWARRSAVLSEQLQQLPASGYAADYFPEHGFAPPVFRGLSWSLLPLDEDRVRVCVSVTLANAADWTQLVRAAHAQGLGAAATEQCTPSAHAAPTTFPATQRLQKTLDRRTVPTATVNGNEAVVQQLTEALRRESFTLTVGQSHVLTVRMAGSGWAGTCASASSAPAALQPLLASACESVPAEQLAATPAFAGYGHDLTTSEAGPGLSVTPSGCSSVVEGASCTVAVQATQEASRQFRSVRLVWAKVPYAAAAGATRWGSPAESDWSRIGVKVLP